MSDYTITLTDEDDAALALQTEQVNQARAAGAAIGPGEPPPPLTPTQVLALRISRALELTRQRLDATVRPVEAMLLPLTPAARVTLIQRIPSAAVRQRIIALLQDR